MKSSTGTTTNLHSNANWTTADEALQAVKRGQRIFVGSGAAEPQHLVKTLTEHGYRLADSEIVHLMTLGSAPYASEDYKHIFRHNALFVGANVRDAVREGRADYTPTFLSEIPHLFRARRIHLDVALIQVSPPDIHGFCSMGIAIDVVKSAADSADLVIAEVNPQMPRTCGDSFIHIRDIDYLVEHDSPLLESIPATPDDAAKRIGENIAELIANGSTLQMGIGSIPNAVLAALKDKRDLGIHTEMFSDGVIDLIEAGIINGARKTLLNGKIVSSFCFGTRRLYDYVDNNPIFEFRPVEFTNDPFTIARNRKMVAINAAIEIDLTGQICSDSIGYNFYSGIGGQVDFIRGAARSDRGKPIIALKSTARSGTVSRIVPHLAEGAGVVTTRGDVHFVVTEYGVADLWGKSVRERTLALISIAHPDFREQLMEEAKARQLIYPDQKTPGADIPKMRQVERTLEDGTEVKIRPVRADDERILKDLFYSLSEETIAQRFFSSIQTLPHDRLQDFSTVDYQQDMIMIAVLSDDIAEKAIAITDYHVDHASGFADIAFVVQDDYQGKGLGNILFAEMQKIARGQGIKGFTADVLAENQKMLNVFYSSGLQIRSRMESGSYQLKIYFDKPPAPSA